MNLLISFFRLFLLMAVGGDNSSNASSGERLDGTAIVDPWG